jgi:hypothetical protein
MNPIFAVAAVLSLNLPAASPPACDPDAYRRAIAACYTGRAHGIELPLGPDTPSKSINCVERQETTGYNGRI